MNAVPYTDSRIRHCRSIQVPVVTPPLLWLTTEVEPYSHYRDGIVIEDCWDIFGRKLIGSVRDQEAGLSHGTVADDHASAIKASVSRLADYSEEPVVDLRDRSKQLYVLDG